MVDEILYAVLGISSCYTAFHLVQAFRNGEFDRSEYQRPPVFATETRPVRRLRRVTSGEPAEPVDSRR